MTPDQIATSDEPQRRYTEARLRNTIRAAIDAGFQVGGIEVTLDGTIRLLPATDISPQPDRRTPREW